MRRIKTRIFIVTTGLILVLFAGGTASFSSSGAEKQNLKDSTRLALVIGHKGSAPELDRPAVAFDHDLHTTALQQTLAQDCAVCHVMQETDKRLNSPYISIFKFPKQQFDRTDKSSIMYAYHTACAGCHKQMSAEGKKTGPPIGLCGKCHVRKASFNNISWAWRPIFNYASHVKHVEAADNFDPSEKLIIAEDVEVLEASDKNCETCHHAYDENLKKLIYKKDIENSCRACHKAKEEKNARTMRQVAHAACIGCHMKLGEAFHCKSCHGEHKQLSPDKIVKISRLRRGQKDMMDLVLKPAYEISPQGVQEVPIEPGIMPPIRMKEVPFNHKAHEPRAQFCNTCHHKSLEKCVNCHTPNGNPKGGGVSYERAFHRIGVQQSCLGCHASVKEDQKCAGCHQFMTTGMPNSSCRVCHRGASYGDVIEIPLTPAFRDSDKLPEKLLINVLENEFKPAELPHLRIVNTLLTISNVSPLARWFHSVRKQALCSGCHHKSELQQTAANVPKCSACHSRPFDPKKLGKPGIMAAYHQQCIGCHETMKQKPAALECVKCHPTEEDVQTAGLEAQK